MIHEIRIVNTLTLFGVFALMGTAMADVETQVIDLAHSTFDFEVKSFLVDTKGTFKNWEGEVNLDRDNIENSSVSVSIQARSIDTRSDTRDAHLRGSDFLDVDKYPAITFESKAVKKTGEKTFDLVGDFTLHGVTKTITIPVTIDRLQDNYSRFRGSVDLSRKAFGVDYNSSLNPIEDTVKVSLVINIKKPEK